MIASKKENLPFESLQPHLNSLNASNINRALRARRTPISIALIIFITFAICLIPTSSSAAPILHSQSSFNDAKLPDQSRVNRKNLGTFARGRILISPREGLPIRAFANILEEHNGQARKIGQSNLYIVDLPEYTEEDVVARLAHHPHLKFAELDHITHQAFTPNDPLYTSQWHLPKINAPIAWDTTQGSNVTIAILDSGANGSHPDLAGQLVPGWNLWDNNSDTTDLTGHGTYVTGTAAASSNNATGIAAVADQAKIMPIRVTPPDSGGTYYSTLAQGLIYAADHGARVANASFQNVSSSLSTQNAAQYMKDKNGLVTVSAGNTGVQEAYTPTTTMIPVSATDENDLLTSFSSYGDFVALAAPGTNIWTTDMNGNYSTVRGTSFSSPIAAGVIALMMASNPKLTNLDIEKLLYSTAVDLGNIGRDVYFGYGRIDAAAAVKAAIAASPSIDSQAPTVSIVNPLSGATVSGLIPVDIQANDNVGVTRAELWVNNTTIAVDTSPPFAFTWDSSGAPNGTANLVAYVYDAAGNSGSNMIGVNVSNSAPLPLVDSAPPTIAIINPVAGNVSGTVTISVNASDNNGSSNVTQSLYIDGALVATGTGSTLSFSWNSRSKKVKAGSHTIQAIAQDTAGNKSSTSVSVNVIK